jgi:hypothetical protein
MLETIFFKYQFLAHHLKIYDRNIGVVDAGGLEYKEGRNGERGGAGGGGKV